MHAAAALVVGGSFAFVATMIDNLFAFAAQLAVTTRERFAPVSLAQSAGVVTLVGLAAVVGTSLHVVPARWVAILALAPWSLAWRSWHRPGRSDVTVRRGVTTTFLVTIGLGGDNLAVWIPLWRTHGTLGELALVAIFAAWQLLFVATAWALASRPRVVRWGQRSGRFYVPWLYVTLGVVILFECHVL